MKGKVTIVENVGKLSKHPRLIKALRVSAGILALILAYLGIIIPGFPAVPFIILAAYLFANSSPKLHSWLMRQRILRKLLTKAKKVDRRIFKGLMISQVWFSVGVVEFTLAQSVTAKILVAAGGVVLTALVLIFMKTKPGADTPVSEVRDKSKSLVADQVENSSS